MNSDTLPPTETEQRPRKDHVRALLKLLDGPLIVLLAGLVFLAAIYFVVVQWRVMPVTRARLVEVHEFLVNQAESGNKGDVYFLGSSVLLEGVDCDLSDPVLPDDVKSYNLALMGAGAPQWILLAPALREVTPSRVLMTVDLTGVTGLQKIPEEGMAIADYWDFFTQEDIDRFSRFFSDEQLETLNHSKLRTLLDFRVFPIGAFDMYMREVSRKGLRYEGYSTNFKNPWVRLQRVSDASTARWIAGKVEKVDEQTPAMMDEQIAMIAELINYFDEVGTQSIIVVAPVNPLLSEALGEQETSRIMNQLLALSDRTSTPLLNHKNLLTADDFADHVHPYEPGRTIWSNRLATDLDSLLAH